MEKSSYKEVVISSGIVKTANPINSIKTQAQIFGQLLQMEFIDKMFLII